MGGLTLVFLLALVRISFAGCPPGYDVINNICYGLKTAASLDWERADKLCHEDHTRLARVDADQLPSLLKVLPRGARAWVGLRFDMKLGKWIWTKDHSSADLTLPYLTGLDPNATEEDDCAVIRLKKNVLTIETDACADKWINTALCSMEKESCGYSMARVYSQCEFDANETCRKKGSYDIDGGSLPRHANVCQVDDVDCRVVFNRTNADSVSCAVECGENVGKNDTVSVSDDCKRATVAVSCDCGEAAAALAKASRRPDGLGLYIGVTMLYVIAAVMIIGIIINIVQRQRKSHSERIHPPALAAATVRYTIDPIRYSPGTVPY